MYKFERLELHRLQIDLTKLFKIVQHFVACNIYNVLNFRHASHNNKGHWFKLISCFTIKCCFKYFFTNRIINVWYSLDDNCSNTNSTKYLKSKLTKIDFSRFIPN